MAFALGFSIDNEPVWFNLDRVQYIKIATEPNFYFIEINDESAIYTLMLRLPNPNELIDNHPKFYEMTKFWDGQTYEWA